MPFPSFPIHNTRDNIVVFDNNYNQLFPDAIMMQVNIKEEAKVMEHPIETGETITDHAITQPVEIELDIFVPSFSYKNTYNIVNKIFLDFTLVNVQTNTATYTNQLISSMPHAESAEMIDSTVIHLKLKQALFIQPQYGEVPISPKNPNNGSTNDRGVQNPSPTTPPLESEWHRQNRLAQR